MTGLDAIDEIEKIKGVHGEALNLYKYLAENREEAEFLASAYGAKISSADLIYKLAGYAIKRIQSIEKALENIELDL